jgi:hypothetical protein
MFKLKINRSIVVVPILFFLLLSSITFAQSSSRPFSGMAGRWSGSGTISLAGGDQERVRCKATYAIGNNGTVLQQSLRCASDSYKFELSSDVVSNDGKLTGTWREITRNISGNLHGTATSGRFQVVVSAAAFSANVFLTTRGSSQSVVIRSEGSEFKGASITLARG